ncbi:ABC transporter ATP-binding protein [Cellulomonas sp. NPDC055163]
MSDTTLAALGGDAARPAQYGHDALVACDNLVRIYQSGSVEVQALQGLDLLVHEGEMVAVVGASGSGKSTLLGVLSGLDAPTAGSVRVGRWDLMAMGARDRVAYRRQMVGFVWQQTSRNLLPYLTARQNVALPITSGPRRRRRARADELLGLVGVGHVADRQPHEMSGGEQQRVAIATALANAPRLVLADEPTGELDTTTTQEVFETLQTVNREAGTTVVVVTHDPAVSSLVERTVAIRDGRTSSEVLRRETGGDVVHEEYAVMDRAGRLQVPREYREALALTSRVRLVLEADHVGVWRDGGAA